METSKFPSEIMVERGGGMKIEGGEERRGGMHERGVQGVCVCIEKGRGMGNT